MRLILRSKLFIKLCVCNMMYGIAMEGLADLLLQYAGEKLHLSDEDTGLVIIAFGAGTLLVQLFLLRPLYLVFNDRQVLIFGTGFSTVK